MKWAIGLTYDGTMAEEHGPVTQFADDSVTWAGVLTCGSKGGPGYTEVSLIVEADSEDDACEAAVAVADRWAGEVGIPVPATNLVARSL